ncbi:hypothetical protein QQ045_011051 [Rhodiola kirilowii]
MLVRVSSFRSRAGSIAVLLKDSLSSCIRRNQVTKCMLSSGCLSSSAFLPVIISISITPKLKTSTFVVTRPVTVDIIRLSELRPKKMDEVNNSVSNGKKSIILFYLHILGRDNRRCQQFLFQWSLFQLEPDVPAQSQQPWPSYHLQEEY